MKPKKFQKFKYKKQVNSIHFAICHAKKIWKNKKNIYKKVKKFDYIKKKCT